MPVTISYSFAVIGVLKVAFWMTGAILAGYRKRGFLVVGFTLAGINTTSRALTDAGIGVPSELTRVSAVLAVVTAFLIVGSFVWAQPRGVRPQTWTL